MCKVFAVKNYLKQSVIILIFQNKIIYQSYFYEKKKGKIKKKAVTADVGLEVT